MIILFSLFVNFGNAQESSKRALDSLDMLYSIASKHYENYDYSNSILNAKKVVNYARELDNDEYLAWGYDLMADINAFIGELEEAETHYLKAVYHADIAPDYEVKSYVYLNAGMFYGLNPDKIKASEDLHNKIIKLATQQKDVSSLIYNYIALGSAHRLAGNFGVAEYYLNRSEPYINSPIATAENKMLYNYLRGIFARKKNKDTKAEDYFEAALKIGEENGISGDFAEVLTTYGEFLVATKQFEKASRVYKKYADIDIENFNVKKIAQARAANSSMQLEEYKNILALMKRDKENSALMARKSRLNTIYGIAVFIVLNILLILLFIGRNRLSKANKELQVNNTELTVARDNAERLSGVRRRFVSRVSHELRTPLYGVVGLTDILVERYPQLENDENLKALKFSGNYLMTLINNILQVDKMDADKIVIEKKPFYIERLVQDLGNTFNFSLNKGNNKLHLHFDKDIHQPLMGDDVKISQVLINLLGNASKFTKNGNIWLDLHLMDASASTNTVRFTVRDDGPGISEEDQKVIFDEFSQVGEKQTTYQGTGLGLSIVKSLVEAMGSKIVLRSEPNKGTKLSFEICFAIGTVKKTIKVGNPSSITVSNKSKNTVLVVDDNKTNLLIARKYLESDKFNCVVLENGYDAIDIMGKEHFDLVLMDINMPGINGIETTKRLRAINDKVPIIAFTAVDHSESNKDYVVAGFNDLIIKPSSKDQLLEIVWKNLKASAKFIGTTV